MASDPSSNIRRLLSAMFVLATLSIGASAVPGTAAEPGLVGYRIVASYPHDPSAFTEGLFFRGGKLFESTGIPGQSSVRQITLRSGAVERIFRLEAPHFGEGLAHTGKHWIQLTWRSFVAVELDDELHEVRRIPYPDEGWGLTSLGTNLIASDGSDTLMVLDPDTLLLMRQVPVTAAGRPIQRLNSLDAIGSLVLANVWLTDRIACIDPKNGHVQAWIDLAPLRTRMPPFTGPDARDDVPNGIAHDPATGHIFVTGKRWPLLFELEADLPSLPQG